MDVWIQNFSYFAKESSLQNYIIMSPIIQIFGKFKPITKDVSDYCGLGAAFDSVSSPKINVYKP